jgi:hypothetical protein
MPERRRGQRCPGDDPSCSSRSPSVRSSSRSSVCRPRRPREPTPVRSPTGTSSQRRRSSRFRGPMAVRPPRSRSTWAWCRAPSTTPSTRSARSTTSRICSTSGRGRRPRSMLRSRRRRTTCSPSSSRLPRTERRSPVGRPSSIRLPPNTQPPSTRSPTAPPRGGASRLGMARSRHSHARGQGG